MTRAEQVNAALSHGQMSWTELLEDAETVADAYDQDYENEMTYFEYGDGSVAVFCGVDRSIKTYGSRA